MSQCNKILAHMQEHGSITPLEAYSLYKSLACHSRIAELRERGHDIVTEMVETPSGKVVGRYRLQKAAAQSSTSFVRGGASKEALRQGENASAAPSRLDPVLVNYGRDKKGRELSFVVEGYAPGCAPWER